MIFGSCERLIISQTSPGFDGGRYKPWIDQVPRPYFFQQLGDLHYEDYHQGQTTEEWRELYRTMPRQPSRNLMWRTLPFNYMWDDHDSDLTPGPRINEMYREALPHYDLPIEDCGYHTFKIGRARVIVLDFYSKAKGSSFPSEERTTFGEDQLSLMETEMLTAKDDPNTKLIVLYVPEEIHVTNNIQSNDRARIRDFVIANELSGMMCYLHGDYHMLAMDSGINNNFGGFPIFCAANIVGTGTNRGGEWSEGIISTGAQNGLVTVTDAGGDTVSVDFSGRNTDNEEVMAMSFVTEGDESNPANLQVSIEGTIASLNWDASPTPNVTEYHVLGVTHKQASRSSPIVTVLLLS